MRDIPLPNDQVSLNGLRALLKQRSLLAALEVFHRELGDVFQIPVRGFNPVMLVGAEANRFLLVDAREEVRWRAEEDPVTRLLRHGILVEDGESHDALRRTMNPTLHRRALKAHVEAMWRCTDSVMDTWGGKGAKRNMLVEMRRTTLLILVQTLFGVDFAPDLERLWKPILRTLKYIAPGPWVVWRDVPRPGYRRAIGQLDAYLHRVIGLRRGGSSQDDLLGVLIDSGMSDAWIRDQLLTMIIAGHDTSTALLAWALYFLSSRPDVQAKAREEVVTLFGAQPPEFERIGELRYLDQVINETLRLYPPIHLGSRIAAQELKFQEYTIPAGRRVLYSIYLTHRDAKVWTEPAAFIPERFAPESAQQRRAYTYLPFGGGPRNCIGVAFAQVEAKVVLARILQRFELDYAGKTPGVHMGATLEPSPAVPVRVRARDQSASA